jgi:hypothetical protein
MAQLVSSADLTDPGGGFPFAVKLEGASETIPCHSITLIVGRKTRDQISESDTHIPGNNVKVICLRFHTV